MLFWVLFALMTGAAIFAVLWPLSRKNLTARSSRDAQLAVYRDQLTEIERDRKRGVLAASEAEASHIEISRRLLAADALVSREYISRGTTGRRRTAAVMALAGIPVFAAAFYLALGSPGLPDAPLAARLALPPEQQDVAILVQKIESHLAQNPNDGRGWEIIAPVYARTGRAADAVNARRNAIRLLGANADRQADLGEAIIAAEHGIVTADARNAFEKARKLNPNHAKANFFLALAAEQQGRKSEALAILNYILTSAAPGDPWAVAVKHRLDRIRVEARGKQ